MSPTIPHRTAALVLIGLASLSIAPACAQGMNPGPPPVPGPVIVTEEVRRTAEIRGHLFMLKGMLNLREDQVEAWTTFETGVNTFNTRNQGFARDFCTYSDLRDQNTNLVVAARRTTALSVLFQQRATALEALEADIAPLRSGLDGNQKGRYQTVVPFLLRALLVPPTALPETGVPITCTPRSIQGVGPFGPNFGPRNGPGVNRMPGPPRPGSPESRPGAIPL